MRAARAGLTKRGPARQQQSRPAREKRHSPSSHINRHPFTTRLGKSKERSGSLPPTHWIATAVGMAHVAKGGNAFDAGAAAAFTLQVVELHLKPSGG